MESRLPLIPAMAAILVLGAAACAPATTAPAEPQSGAVGQPVAAAVPAPICQSGSSCQATSVEQYEIDCVKKIPYTNVLVEPGTSFEVLDKSGDFTCRDSGTVVNGKTVLTCFGKELYRFDLKLTNPACAGGALQTGTGQCQEGYGYDAGQQCCAPISPEGSGSVVFSVELGACPLPH
jgi:hypothetical protein